MRLYSNRERPAHLGPLALEGLARDPAAPITSGSQPGDTSPAGEGAVSHVMDEYFEVFARHLEGDVAPVLAPVPDDPAIRANNLKASAYFLDADIAGCCEIGPEDRLLGYNFGEHGIVVAFVFAIEFGREPEAGEPGAEWIRGANVARTDLRAAELAAVLSGYVRWMGHPARGHFAGDSQVDLGRLAVKAGVARVEDGALVVPFLARGFRLGVVTTDYALAPDRPLATEGPLVPDDPEIQSGVGGTRPTWHYTEEARFTGAAIRWRKSRGPTIRRPSSCATKSSACPSAATSSSGLSRATLARRRRRSATASR